MENLISMNSAVFDPADRQESDLVSDTFAPGSIEVRVSVEVSFVIE